MELELCEQWRWVVVVGGDMPKRGRRIECSACDVCESVCVLSSVKVQWTKLQVERIYHGQSQKSISNVSKVFYSLTHPPARCVPFFSYFWGENASDSIPCVILVSTIHTFSCHILLFFSFSSFRSFSISHNLYLYFTLFPSQIHSHTLALSINLLYSIVLWQQAKANSNIQYWHA